MNLLLDEVRRRWPDWFGQQPPPELEHVLLARPSAAPRRGVLVVGSRRASAFAAVIKVALDQQASVTLRREAEATVTMSELLRDQGLEPLAPRLIDRFDWADTYVLVQEFRAGSPLEIPFARSGRTWAGSWAIRRYLKAAAEVSRRLGALAEPTARTVGSLLEPFARHADEQGAGRTAEAARVLADLDVHVPAGWQHGDVAPGNILLDRGRLTLIDWEMARPDYPLFFDTSYAFLSVFNLGSGDPARVPSAIREAIRPGSRMRRVLPHTPIAGLPDDLADHLALALTACYAATRSTHLGRAGPDSIWWPVANDLVQTTAALVGRRTGGPR